jgi:uncharacterized protein YkwD
MKMRRFILTSCAPIVGAIALLLLTNGGPANGEGSWNKIYGTLKHVSVGKAWVWGVNAQDQIFRCKRPCTGEWSQVDGALKQVDVGDTVVWGVNANGQILTRPADGSGSWHTIYGVLKHVSVGKAWVWGVNAQDKIFRCKRPCTGAWSQVDGALKQVDVGGTVVVWGVNANGQIFTRPADGSGSWKRIPGELKHVSVGKAWVWGVNARDKIFRCKRPCTGAWSQVDGALKQVDVGDTVVWGVNAKGQIFTRPANGADATAGESPPPPRDNAFAKEILDAHNEYRARHGVQPLRWAEPLARIANDWARSQASQGCPLKHNPDLGQTLSLGENIAGAMSVGPGAGKTAVSLWYNEVSNYNYSKPEISSRTGHFTQVVWASTTELGCAIAPCVGTADLNDWRKRGGLVVCNYYQPGNYKNKIPENVRPPVR